MKTKVKVLDEELKKILREQRERAKDLSPVLTKIKVIMKKKTLQCFENEKDPYGKKWKPLSASTKKQRETKAKKATKSKRKKPKNINIKILNDTGALKRSIGLNSNDKEIVLYSSLEYAAVHQYGSKLKNIPKREFLGISDKDRKKYDRMVRRYIKNGKVINR